MRNRTYPLIYGTETYFFTDKVKLTHGYIRSEIIYPIGEPNRYTQNIAIQPSRVEMELLFAGDGFETKYRNFYKNGVSDGIDEQYHENGKLAKSIKNYYTKKPLEQEFIKKYNIQKPELCSHMIWSGEPDEVIYK